MKILLVTREFPPSVVGGIAYHAYHLARGLSDRGHDVTVLTSDSSRMIVDRSMFPTSDLSVVRISTHERGSPRLWFARAVRRYLGDDPSVLPVDLIHSHEYIDFENIPVDAPILLKIHFNLSVKPAFFSVDDHPELLRPLVRTAYEKLVDPLEQCLARRAVQSANGHIFVSELTRKRCLQDHGTATARPSQVTYNAVDTNRFFPAENDTNGYFLFAGGTQPRKGYEIVKEAFCDLNRRLVVVGADHPSDEAVPDGVFFKGRVDQATLPELYRNATALIHPALYEPFGNVVLESLACGTPVIVSDADYCGAAEILTDDVAKMVDPTSPEMIRRTIATFSPGAFDSRDCRELVEGFTWDRVAKRTVAFYRSLTG